MRTLFSELAQFSLLTQQKQKRAFHTLRNAVCKDGVWKAYSKVYTQHTFSMKCKLSFLQCSYQASKYSLGSIAQCIPLFLTHLPHPQILLHYCRDLAMQCIEWCSLIKPVQVLMSQSSCTSSSTSWTCIGCWWLWGLQRGMFWDHGKWWSHG